MTDQNVEILDERFPTQVKEILDQVIKNEGYISDDTTYTTITTKASLLASLHEVNVEGKTNNGHKESLFFIKLQRQNNIDFFTIGDFFNREFYAYSELFKIYEELQDSVNVPYKEKFKAVKCFDGSTSEAIIFKNLSRKGFKTLPKMEVVSLLFSELCIKQLAKFHALSVVLKYQRPEYFSSMVVKPLENFLINDSQERDAVVKKVFNVASKYLSQESKKSIAILLDTIEEEINKHQKNTEMFKCLCHGDFRAESFLFRVQDSRIKEGIIIDYQMINYGSPIDDLTYFIFLETDREFRRKYLDHLKNFYYTSFEQFLKYFDIDLNVLWSKDKFENQFEESLNYELIQAMLAFPFIFVDENYVPVLGNDIMEMNIEPDIRYKDRIQGLVDNFIEWRDVSSGSSENINSPAPNVFPKEL